MKEIKIKVELPVAIEAAEGLRIRVWTQRPDRYLVFTSRDMMSDEKGLFIVTNVDEMDALDSGVVEYAYSYYVSGDPEEKGGHVVTDFYWRNPGGMRVPGARVAYAMIEKLQERTIAESDAVKKDNAATLTAIRESNAATVQTVTADNADTVKAVTENNAATVKAVNDDNLLTRQDNERTRETVKETLTTALAEKEQQLEEYTQGALSEKADKAVVATEEQNGLMTTEQVKALAAAPRQTFIDMWNEACVVSWGSTIATEIVGKYNKETGFFELNGLTDITFEEAIRIYMYSCGKVPTGLPQFSQCNIRTILPMKNLEYSTNLKGMFRYGVKFEVLIIPSYYRTYVNIGADCSGAFQNCYALKKINAVMQFGAVTTASYTFYRCDNLIDVSIENLKINLSFENSPLLSYDSLQYLVIHAANTSPITITVHTDVYAKLTADLSNGAASALSGEELAKWTALLSDAVAKNISFAAA